MTGANMLEDPRAGALVLSSRDVTERVEAEAEVRRLNAELEARVAERTAELRALVARLEENERNLRESEVQFRTAFELAAVGMAHLAPNGRILRANRRPCEVVGYPEEELLLRSWYEISHPDALATYAENARRAFSGEAGTFSVEQRCVRRDFSQVWVRLTASLVRCPKGSPG